MPLVWKFVTEPTASPAVLLDMNNGSTWRTLGGDSLDLSPPPLRRTIASNSLADGGLVTSASYELRELRFTVQLGATTEDGRNTQLKDLEAELSKPTNLIMYQATDSSFPVFFRTLRSDTFDLDTETMPKTAWRVHCSVLAEPFAIGVRHDIVSSLTLTNDPAAGTNPARFDITGIRGDSPSPAFVRVTSLAAGGTLILGTRSMNNPTALVHWSQAESMTLGTDTTSVADANGSGGNIARTSFSTDASLVSRLTATIPTASSGEALRGRYRVYIRCKAQAGGATFNARWQVAGSDTVSGPTVSHTGSTSYSLLDLGVVEVPAVTNAPQAIGYSALAPTGYTLQLFSVQVQRLTGATGFDVDYVFLMPCDERLCAVNQVAALTSGYVVLDGPNTACYGMASGTSAFGVTRTLNQDGGLTPFIGGLPMLVPGVTNRWYALVNAATVSSTKTVDVSYWPRWREVATS